MNHCCVAGCTREAEYEIHEQGTSAAGEPHAYTPACQSHVGELLGCVGEPIGAGEGVWWVVQPLKPGEGIKVVQPIDARHKVANLTFVNNVRNASVQFEFQE